MALYTWNMNSRFLKTVLSYRIWDVFVKTIYVMRFKNGLKPTYIWYWIMNFKKGWELRTKEILKTIFQEIERFKIFAESRFIAARFIDHNSNNLIKKWLWCHTYSYNVIYGTPSYCLLLILKRPSKHIGWTQTKPRLKFFLAELQTNPCLTIYWVLGRIVDSLKIGAKAIA